MGAKVLWTAMPAALFPLGEVQVADAVREERTWVAITSASAHCSHLTHDTNMGSVNKGASERLRRSLGTPNATYDGKDAISVFAVEARNENA